ncbi:FtsX-like permease family protein [Proteinivorax tanatarense]|uniref:FtsX-like permease family protein n=1 Tax=Proteinivorax tanatarense TaxID=1260629 RepID=A0AAU7VKP5_9FIRM
MKSVTSLALRYLWYKKRKTVLTVLGIIISVSMLTSIGTISVTFREDQIDRYKKTNGAHHAKFSNVETGKYAAIESNPKVDKVAKKITVGKGSLEGTGINFYSISDDFFYLTNYSLRQGRMPIEDDEIALEGWFVRQLDISVGDKVKLSISDKDDYLVEAKEFKLVGVVDRYYFSQSIASAILSYDYAQSVNQYTNADIFITVKERLTVRNVVEEVGTEVGLPQYNRSLLMMMGEAVDRSSLGNIVVMASIVAFLGLIVCACTIAVIYNSFNISVMERVKQFGILRSIGCTPKQIRRIVFVEAGVQSAIGIPLGMVAGLAAMHLVFYILSLGEYSNFTNVNVVISPLVFTITFLVSVSTVFLSALAPANNAAKKQPTEAIFYRPPKPKKEFKPKKGYLLKIFSTAEIFLAYKNLQRNKKRSVLTALSLSISVILFIVFYVFSSYIIILQNEMVVGEHDITITTPGGGYFTEKDLNEIKSLKGVDEVYAIKAKTTRGVYLPENLTRKFRESKKENDIVTVSARLMGYDEEQLSLAEQHLVAGEIDPSKIRQEKGVLVVPNKIINDQGRQWNEIQALDLEVGEEVLVDLHPSQNRGEKDNNQIKPAIDSKFKVMGILEAVPIGPPIGRNEVYYVTHKDLVKSHCQGYNEIYINGIDNLDQSTHHDLNRELNEISSKIQGAFVADHLMSAKISKQSILEVSIFMYGFIALVSTIGALNIINSISTSLLTRVREFAELRAVGMGPKKLRKMIRYEASLSGLIGVFYGCIAGNLLGYCLYRLMSRLEPLEWYFPWRANVIVILAVLVISLLASRATIEKVKNMDIIESLRQEG